MNPISAYRGSLNMYFQVELDSATATFGPAMLLGNLTSFELTPSAETVDVISTLNEDYGQAADSMVEPSSTTVSATANRFNLSTEALAMLGDIEVLSTEAKTVTDESLGTVKAGDIVRLAGLGVSDLVLSSAGSPVDEERYRLVEPTLGLVKILDAGDYTASYTVGAQNGTRLTGGTNSAKFVRLLGRGVNRYNSKETIIKISRSSVAPSGGFSLVGTDNSEIGLDFVLLTPADGSPAFEMIETGN